ncbi:MAG: LPS assembly lipoprotein LptE [Alphaproteobacteria bacterium]|nr:LPS assembly lipoprotein LptE [Alphaproteobacteria bacterium]
MALTRRLFSAGLLGGVLVGCGFHPRQPDSYGFGVILIPANPSPLLTELRRLLAADRRIEVLQDLRQFERADLRFELLQETREKIVIGRNTAGGVREFQLRLRVRFRVRDRSGIERVPETELLQQRDISFSESAVLSKEVEEELLYRNMQSDVVQQIVWRLARLRPAGA